MSVLVIGIGTGDSQQVSIHPFKLATASYCRPPDAATCPLKKLLSVPGGPCEATLQKAMHPEISLRANGR